MVEMKDKKVNLRSKSLKLHWRSGQVLQFVADNPKISTSSVLAHFRSLGIKETNKDIEGILNKLYQAGLLTIINNLWTANGKLESC
jgi:hypothetical protein